MTKMNKIMIGVIAVLSVSTVAMGVKLINNNKEEEAVDVMVSNVKEGTTVVTDADVDITSTFTTTIASATTIVTTTTTEPLTTTTTVVEVSDGIPKTSDDFYNSDFREGYVNLNDVDGYLNVRKTPDSSGEVLCTLGYHEFVQYIQLDETPGWYMVYVNGVLGYVSADYVAEGTPPKDTFTENNNDGGNSSSGDTSLIEKFPLTARLPLQLHDLETGRVTYQVDDISYRVDQDANGQYTMTIYQYTITNIDDPFGANASFDITRIYNEAGDSILYVDFDMLDPLAIGESAVVNTSMTTSAILPGNYYLGDSSLGLNLKIKWGVEHDGYYYIGSEKITKAPTDIWEPYSYSD